MNLNKLEKDALFFIAYKNAYAYYYIISQGKNIKITFNLVDYKNWEKYHVLFTNKYLSINFDEKYSNVPNYILKFRKKYNTLSTIVNPTYVSLTPYDWIFAIKAETAILTKFNVKNKFYDEPYFILNNKNQVDHTINKIKKIGSLEDRTNNMWVIKDSMVDGGKGVQLSDIKSLRAKLLNFLDKSNNVIVQPYINDIITLDSFYTKDTKFDIRLIVMCDTNGNVYASPNFFVRIAGETYDMSSTDEKIFMTNFHIAKKNELIQNSEWFYEKYENKYPDEKDKIFGIDNKNNQRVFFNKMVDIIKHVYDEMKKNNYLSYINDNKHKYFSLYGYDFIIGKSRKPYLIEINPNPGFKWSDIPTKELIDNIDVIDDIHTKSMLEHIYEYCSIVFPNNFEKKYNNFIKIWSNNIK
jgi:hypothetical protein